jgi:type II secretory pathway component GspD/PulD (secretin)
MIPTPKLAKALLASALTAALAAPCALAQGSDSAKQPNPCQTQTGPISTKVFYLENTKPAAPFMSGYRDYANGPAEEIQVALKNMLCPADRVFLMGSQGAIAVQGDSAQLDLAEKLIRQLDRPDKAYRLTYTMTELDGGKTISTQHFSMIALDGQHTSMKEGSKIPVATGSVGKGDDMQTEFTYLDIGMNFDSSIEEVANGVRLQAKVEQSSLGQPSTIAGVQEPVVRQTVLQGTSFLTLGKPVMLGSVDVPNTTRHFDIAVVADELK